MQRKRKAATDGDVKPPAKGGLRTAMRSVGDDDEDDEGGVVVVAPLTKESTPPEFRLNCPHLKGISFAKTSKTLFDPALWGCADCGTTESSWVCLECGRMGCSRYINGHAKQHFETSEHSLAFEINTKLCYCYTCDSFVPNDNRREDLSTIRQRLEEIVTCTVPESKTRRGTVLRASQHVPSEQALLKRTKNHQFEDKVFSAVQHWRLQALSRAFNKWRQVCLQGLLSQLIEEEENSQKEVKEVRDANDSKQGDVDEKIKESPSNERRGKRNNTEVALAALSTKAGAVKGGQLQPGLTGLRNLGNTCFMNATLQALASFPRWREYFLQQLLPPKTEVVYQERKLWRQETIECFKMATVKQPKLSERSLCLELHNLLRVSWSGKYALMTPFALLSLVKFLIPKFRSYQQQDAQEFLCYLRDIIHNELVEGFKAAAVRPASPFVVPAPKVIATAAAPAALPKATKQRTIIEELFQGRLVSEVVCQTCKASSKTGEDFLDLSLDIPVQHLAKMTRKEVIPSCELAECLASFTKEEKLEGYSCEKCKSPQTASKRILIEQAPQHVCLVLKRFAWNVGSSKVDTHVKFPIKSLNLAPYAVGNAPLLYDLRSFVVHHGAGLKVGHYTALVYNEIAGPDRKGAWLHFNDARVIYVTEETVASHQAYILFYQRRGAQVSGK